MKNGRSKSRVLGPCESSFINITISDGESNLLSFVIYLSYYRFFIYSLAVISLSFSPYYDVYIYLSLYLNWELLSLEYCQIFSVFHFGKINKTLFSIHCAVKIFLCFFSWTGDYTWQEMKEI